MKKWKQMISGLFLICLFIVMAPMSVEADEYIPEPDEELSMNEVMEIDTTMAEITFFNLDRNGEVEMKETNEVRWIDRIKDLPVYAKEFYDWLIENGDGDRTEDALIDITQADFDGSNTYYHPVLTLDVSADFTFDPNVSKDELGSVMNKAANEAFGIIEDSLYKEISPYISNTIAAFGRDYSEVFWLSSSWIGRTGVKNYRYVDYDTKEGTGTVAGEIAFAYFLKGVNGNNIFYSIDEKYINPETIYATKAEIEPIINKVVQEAEEHVKTDNSVTYSRKSKLDYFNDWLTEHNCYNTSSNLNTIDKDCRNIVSAFRNDPGTRGPVCEAYARAFKILCDRIDVPCVLVTGKANGGEHMWNYVQMNDGKWYAVDVTWNDPTGGKEGPVSGYERDLYFLIGANSVDDWEDKFSESHTVTNQALVNGAMFLNGPVLEDEAYDNNLAQLDFAGASLTLHDNLAINFKVDSKLFDEQGFTNPYVVFTMNGTETTVSDCRFDKSAGRYIFDFKNIAPNRMNDTVYATLYAEYNGTTCFSEPREYKVADYCYNMLEKYSEEDHALFRTLLVDLLNYGAYSQIFTGYNASGDGLVNSRLTENQKSWGTAENSELKNARAITENRIENPVAEWTGAGLLLNDRIEIRFKLKAASIEGLTAHIKSASGREWDIPASAFVVNEELENATEYYVYFRGLNAAQMRETVELTVMKDEVPVSETLTYSIESYAYAKQDDTKIVGLADLVMAMMKYGDAAAAYVEATSK